MLSFDFDCYYMHIVTVHRANIMKNNNSEFDKKNMVQLEIFEKLTLTVHKKKKLSICILSCL